LKEFAEDSKQSQKVVDGYLADIRAGKLDNAYQSTTKEFKAHMSRKEFEDLIKQHPGLMERPTASNINMNSPNPPGTPETFPNFHQYSYKAQGKDGKDKIDFTVTLDKEDGQMKVDQFTVTKEEATKENGDGPP